MWVCFGCAFQMRSLQFSWILAGKTANGRDASLQCACSGWRQAKTDSLELLVVVVQYKKVAIEGID